MDQIWNKLIKGLDKLSAQSKDFNYDLNEGVTDKKIASVEKTIGKALPEDFKQFYKVHNGEIENGQGILLGEEFLSVERIIEEWNIWKDLLDNKEFIEDGVAIESEPDAGIKNNWWNPFWIPFTYDGSGNHICIDLDPSQDGNYGQIIRMWHDDATRELLANNFTEWITAYTDDLEKGNFVFSDDYGVIIHKDDLIEDDE